MPYKLIIVLILSVMLTVAVVSLAFNRGSDPGSENSGTNQTSETGDNQPQSSEEVKPGTVTIENYRFTPQTLTVKKGTKVTWINKDTVRHNAAAADNTAPGVFIEDAPLLGKNETYSLTFDTAGTFDYICSPHPYMKGKVVVED